MWVDPFARTPAAAVLLRGGGTVAGANTTSGGTVAGANTTGGTVAGANTTNLHLMRSSHS